MRPDWDEQPEPEPRDWSGARRVGAFGGLTVVLVIGWLMAARPGDETQSSRGFSDRGGGTVAPASKALFERRTRTGLDMVQLPGSGSVPEAADAAQSVPAADAAAAPAGRAPSPSSGSSSAGFASPAAAAPVPAAASAPPAPDAADEKTLAAAGLPTDAGGLTRLGGQPGLLSSLAGRMLDHPKVLKAVFNNKLVVDAFMNRPISRRNCSSGSELKSYLSNPDSGGMRAVFPILQQALSKPDTAAALAGTEMGSRLMDCPSVKQLSDEPGGFAQVVAANPKIMGVLTDPRAAMALASNSRASSLLSQATSSLGGGR